jgi:hypothetical protein
MPLALRNNAIIVKDGKLAENCGCCGCKNAYEDLRSKSCVVTLGGDIPAHPGASVGLYTNGEYADGRRVTRPQLYAIKESEWTPERTVFFYAFQGPITILSQTSNWYVVAEKYRVGFPIVGDGITTTTLSEDTLKDQVRFETIFVTAYKATESPIGSHTLAFNVLKSYFFGNSGKLFFEKTADDYKITCEMTVGPIGGACVVSVSVLVETYYWTRPFWYSVSPTFASNSSTLTTDFLDANNLPYKGGAIEEDQFSRQYVPGTYSRQVAYLTAPMYVQSPSSIYRFSESRAQEYYDANKSYPDSYVPVWREDLSLSAVGDWKQGAGFAPQRSSWGAFVAGGQKPYADLLAGPMTNFSFINAAAGIPTFFPSSTKPSPYSATSIDIPATSEWKSITTASGTTILGPILDPKMSGQPDVTFGIFASAGGLTSTNLEMR